MENQKIVTEVKAVLNSLGYKTEVRKTEKYVDLYFVVNNGYETMPVRHKDAIAMLAKGFLMEFYYAGNIQHVYLRRECDGLEPDDDRYGCLLHEIKNVSSQEKIAAEGSELFVNMHDHFKRIVNWRDVTSEEVL